MKVKDVKKYRISANELESIDFPFRRAPSGVVFKSSLSSVKVENGEFLSIDQDTFGLLDSQVILENVIFSNEELLSENPDYFD